MSDFADLVEDDNYTDTDASRAVVTLTASQSLSSMALSKPSLATDGEFLMRSWSVINSVKEFRLCVLFPTPSGVCCSLMIISNILNQILIFQEYDFRNF